MPDDDRVEERLPDEPAIPTPAPQATPAPADNGKPADGAPAESTKPDTASSENALADSAATAPAGDAEGDAAKTDSEGEEGAEGDGEAGPKRGRKPGYLRRAERAEREAEYWRSVAMRQQQPPPDTNGARPPPASEDRPPRVEDFQTPEEFEEARIQHAARRVVAQEMERTRRANAEAGRRERARDVFRQGAEKYGEEFDAVNDANITAPMADAILVQDNAHDIAMHLGRNPAIAAKLARLHPIAAAVEIGRISAQLSAPTPAPRQSAAPSSAPPPPRVLKGGSATPSVDPNAMSPEDYRKWREKGGGA
jgi:hypothetical protein